LYKFTEVSDVYATCIVWVIMEAENTSETSLIFLQTITTKNRNTSIVVIAFVRSWNFTECWKFGFFRGSRPILSSFAGMPHACTRQLEIVISYGIIGAKYLRACAALQ
jgi:hypothetical protein